MPVPGCMNIFYTFSIAQGWQYFCSWLCVLVRFSKLVRTKNANIETAQRADGMWQNKEFNPKRTKLLFACSFKWSVFSGCWAAAHNDVGMLHTSFHSFSNWPRLKAPVSLIIIYFNMSDAVKNIHTLLSFSSC